MKKYEAPELFVDYFAADTMIASSDTKNGNPDNNQNCWDVIRALVRQIRTILKIHVGLPLITRQPTITSVHEIILLWTVFDPA